jgi:hypothetical protein
MRRRVAGRSDGAAGDGTGAKAILFLEGAQSGVAILPGVPLVPSSAESE